MKRKEYIVFWTYGANYPDHPKKVEAFSPKEAISQTTLYTDLRVRHLVFEVGGDLVHDGPFCKAPGVPLPSELDKDGEYDVLVGNIGTVGRFGALDAFECAMRYADGHTRAEGSVVIVDPSGEPVFELDIA